MKKVIFIFALSFSSLSFAAADFSITDILSFTKSETMTRRCVDDGQCRPGAEICVGGRCVPQRENPPRCRVNRDCTPRQCINGRCQ